MVPHPFDERRIIKLLEKAEAIEAEQPRGADWRARLDAVYADLKQAGDRAVENARASVSGEQ